MSIAKWFSQFNSPSRAQPARARNRLRKGGRGRIEALELRQVFAAPTLAAVPNINMLAGTPMQIPLDGFDADGQQLTFTVDPVAGLTTSIHQNHSLILSVSHTKSGASDPESFTGEMVFQLFEDLSPIATARISELVGKGFYDNLTFHRIANLTNTPDGIIIQGGDPLGNGTGGSGVDFDDQFSPSLMHTGTGLLSMAKSSDDTNDSQFFITGGPQRHLDFNHTIFGRLVDGALNRVYQAGVSLPRTLTDGDSVRDKITKVKTTSGVPDSKVSITSAIVVDDTENGVLTIFAPEGTTGTFDITVNFTDGDGPILHHSFKVTVNADNSTFDSGNSNPFLLDIADVLTEANSTATFQLPATDVEGQPIFYFIGSEIDDRFNTFGSSTTDIVPPGTHTSANVVSTVDRNTGVVTVTTKNNEAGIFPIFVGASNRESKAGATSGTAIDTQVVPLLVAPAAPISVDLLTGSDTGSSDNDDYTKFDNSSNTNALQFTVTGVRPGAEVQLRVGNTVIGQAIASGTSVVVTTNGTAPLSKAQHAVTAVQILRNQQIMAGNRFGETADLFSETSAALNITVTDHDIPWQNSDVAADVDDNGDVVTIDAFILLTELNANGPRILPALPEGGPVHFLDVNGNGIFTPIDALVVINVVNDEQSNFASLSGDAPAMAAASADVAPSEFVDEGLTSDISPAFSILYFSQTQASTGTAASAQLSSSAGSPAATSASATDARGAAIEELVDEQSIAPLSWLNGTTEDANHLDADLESLVDIIAFPQVGVA